MTKWPKRVKHRNKVLAKIYRPCAGRSSYRVAWTVAGKRMMKTFPGHAVSDLTKRGAADIAPVASGAEPE